MRELGSTGLIAGLVVELYILSLVCDCDNIYVCDYTKCYENLEVTLYDIHMHPITSYIHV